MAAAEKVPTMSATEYAVEVFRRTYRAGDAGQWERSDAIRDAVEAERDVAPGATSPNGNDGSHAAIDRIWVQLTDAGLPEDIAITTVAKYRNVAQAWPAKDRVSGASYDAHRELASRTYDNNRVKILKRLLDRSSKGRVTRADVRTYKSEMKPKKSTPWGVRFEKKLRAPFNGGERPQAPGEWQEAIELLQTLLTEAREAAANV